MHSQLYDDLLVAKEDRQDLEHSGRVFATIRRSLADLYITATYDIT